MNDPFEDSINPQDMKRIAELYFDINRKQEIIRLQKKEIDERERNLKQTFAALMDQSSQTSYRHASGVTFSTSFRKHFSLPPKTETERRKKAIDWLNANGYADLVEITINTSKLKAAMKEADENGSPPPEALFNMFDEQRISVRNMAKWKGS